jgi:hypothetical protein
MFLASNGGSRSHRPQETPLGPGCVKTQKQRGCQPAGSEIISHDAIENRLYNVSPSA